MNITWDHLGARGLVAQRRWARFEGWCNGRKADVMDADDVLVLAFLKAELFGAPYATARMYVDAIAHGMRRGGREPPLLEDVEISEAIGRTTTALVPPAPSAPEAPVVAENEKPEKPPKKKPEKPPKKKPKPERSWESTRSAPLRFPQLLIKARDEAIRRLRRKVAGLLDRDRYAALTMADVGWDPEGVTIAGQMVVDVRARQALERWLALSGLSNGPLWRKVDPSGTLVDAMTTDEVTAIARNPRPDRDQPGGDE